MNQSLLLKGDAFRRREEIRAAIDMTKTMNERYGYNLFDKTLRIYPKITSENLVSKFGMRKTKSNKYEVLIKSL